MNISFSLNTQLRYLYLAPNGPNRDVISSIVSVHFSSLHYVVASSYTRWSEELNKRLANRELFPSLETVVVEFYLKTPISDLDREKWSEWRSSVFEQYGGTFYQLRGRLRECLSIRLVEA